MWRTIAALVGVWLVLGQTAEAQDASEDVQPHVVGGLGTTMLGFGGYVDRVYSSERLLPLNYTLQVDVGRFITPHLVVRGALSGSGSAGGDDAEDRPTGLGAPAVHASGGLLYYLSPQSMWSLYGGAEYWTQLTQRAARDRGSIVGMLGLEGAASRRVGLFFEGGYGLGFTGPDESTNRLVARVGVRLKF